jgi:bifunctional non-homologous end joining protein LigD
MAFDLLRLYGVDLTSRTLRDRRATLERLDLAGQHWRVPPTFTDGPALYAATREQGLEGVVSKRLTSRYLPGIRSEDWLKLPHRRSMAVVIGGWRPETDQTDRIGSVLVGVPTIGGLRFLGRCRFLRCFARIQVANRSKRDCQRTLGDRRMERGITFRQIIR